MASELPAESANFRDSRLVVTDESIPVTGGVSWPRPRTKGFRHRVARKALLRWLIVLVLLLDTLDDIVIARQSQPEQRPHEMDGMRIQVFILDELLNKSKQCGRHVIFI